MNPAIRPVAIANPDTAPYGEAALSVLRKKGLLETVKPRLVYGESIAQVNQYVLSQSAEMGFTAKSVVLDPALTNRGHWIKLPVTDYTSIAQGVVIIKRTVLPEQAQQFVQFLSSPANPDPVWLPDAEPQPHHKITGRGRVEKPTAHCV